MLPNNGYFKNIFCPYDKAKLCHRPYCHYKHAETDDIGEKIAGDVEETEYLFDTKPTATINRVQIFPQVATAYEVNATYVPTPVSKPVQPVGILKTNSSTTDEESNLTVPVYNPTPISKLKELNTHNHYEANNYSPEYTNPSRKKKNIEEYDPTAVKYISRKSVSFVDQPDASLDNETATAFSSSEDELEDSSSAAQFSDDDLDYRAVATHTPKISEALTKKIKSDVEEDLEEKTIDEYSLVDKILVDSKRNEKLLKSFRKPHSTLKPTVSKKVLQKKSGTKNTSVKKEVEITDVYDVDLGHRGPKVSKLSSSLDPLPTAISTLNSKINKIKTKSISSDKKSVCKVLDDSKSETCINVSSKEEKNKSTSESKSSSSDKSKSKESSKHSVDKSNTKAKHDSSSRSVKSSEKSKLDKTERHKSASSKSEKSCSSSKQEKIKSSVPSSQSEKSTSSSKATKLEKNKPNSSKPSDSKAVKLQDEKVSSSSIVKKNSKHDHSSKVKHEPSTKQSPKSSDSNLKHKSKTSNTDQNPKKKSEKRKVEDSGSESSEKYKSSSLPKKQKIDDEEDSSMDEDFTIE